MRTHNVKFNEKNTLNKWNFNADKEGFRKMRRMVMLIADELTDAFAYRMMDVLDDIKEMPIGETRFVISSRFEPYVAKDINEFNRTIVMMDNASRNDFGENGENYISNEHTAFMVKRTPSYYKFAMLDYERI